MEKPNPAAYYIILDGPYFFVRDAFRGNTWPQKLFKFIARPSLVICARTLLRI